MKLLKAILKALLPTPYWEKIAIKADELIVECSQNNDITASAWVYMRLQEKKFKPTLREYKQRNLPIELAALCFIDGTVGDLIPIKSKNPDANAIIQTLEKVLDTYALKCPGFIPHNGNFGRSFTKNLSEFISDPKKKSEVKNESYESEIFSKTKEILIRDHGKENGEILNDVVVKMAKHAGIPEIIKAYKGLNLTIKDAAIAMLDTTASNLKSLDGRTKNDEANEDRLKMVRMLMASISNIRKP